MNNNNNNNTNNTIRLADDPDARVFFDYAADIQNRTGYEFVNATVMSRFLDSFGCNILVAMNVWSLLDEYSLLPDCVKIPQYLWGLWYMRNYPKQSVACEKMGGCRGALDPKTLRKYVWIVITAIASLESVVVSVLCFAVHSFVCFCSQHFHADKV